MANTNSLRDNPGDFGSITLAGRKSGYGAGDPTPGVVRDRPSIFSMAQSAAERSSQLNGRLAFIAQRMEAGPPSGGTETNPVSSSPSLHEILMETGDNLGAAHAMLDRIEAALGL